MGAFVREHRLLSGLVGSLVVAAVAALGLVIQFCNGEGPGRWASPPPTLAATSTLAPSATSAPAATPTPTAAPVASQEGAWPRFWLTLPDIPPDSWSTSVPRGINVYQTAFVSWQDPAIESWLVDPNSALPDGEYYFYLLRGATADAPSGAKVSVSTIVHRPDWVVGIGSDHGTFAIQEDGTWEGKTQIFPDDINGSTYTLELELRSADDQLLLRASLTISPE